MVTILASFDDLQGPLSRLAPTLKRPSKLGNLTQAMPLQADTRTGKPVAPGRHDTMAGSPYLSSGTVVRRPLAGFNYSPLPRANLQSSYMGVLHGRVYVSVVTLLRGAIPPDLFKLR